MKYIILLPALLLPVVATAGEQWERPTRPPMRAVQPRITMGDAMDRVQRATGGRVLQAQPASINGHEAYRIKVLTAHGEVRVVYVDAETGAMQ